MKTILAIFSFFSIIFYNTSLYCIEDQRTDRSRTPSGNSYDQALELAQQDEAEKNLLNYYIQKEPLHNRTKGRVLFTLYKQGKIAQDTDYDQYFVKHLREHDDIIYCVIELRKLEYTHFTDLPKTIGGRRTGWPSNMTAIRSFEVELNRKDLKP